MPCKPALRQILRKYYKFSVDVIQLPYHLGKNNIKVYPRFSKGPLQVKVYHDPILLMCVKTNWATFQYLCWLFVQPWKTKTKNLS